MTSKNLRSLEIAEETTFATLTDFRSIPSHEESDWEAVDFAQLDQLAIDPETLMDDPSALRSGGHMMPARPVVSSAGTISHGTLSFDFYLRPWKVTEGSGLKLLLASVMGDQECSASAVGSGTIAAETQTVTTSDASDYGAGDVCICSQTATKRAHVALCTAGGTTSITLSPNLAMQGLDGETAVSLYPCDAWTIPTVGIPEAMTVSLRIKGDGWSQTCYGCRLTALTMTSASDSRGVLCSATVDCAYVVTEVDSSIKPAATTVDGTLPIMHQLASPLVIGAPFALGDASFASGHAAASIGACVDEWTLSITWQTAHSACGNYILGRGPEETTGVETSLELHLHEDADTLYSQLETMWSSQKAATVGLGFTSADLQNSMALVLPAAVVTDFTPALDLGGDVVRVAVTFGAGPCPISSIPCLMLASCNLTP